jgi:hypothetical protein
MRDHRLLASDHRRAAHPKIRQRSTAPLIWHGRSVDLCWTSGPPPSESAPRSRSMIDLPRAAAALNVDVAAVDAELMRFATPARRDTSSYAIVLDHLRRFLQAVDGRTDVAGRWPRLPSATSRTGAFLVRGTHRHLNSTRTVCCTYCWGEPDRRQPPGCWQLHSARPQ